MAADPLPPAHRRTGLILLLRPQPFTLATLVKIAGLRWTVERYGLGTYVVVISVSVTNSGLEIVVPLASCICKGMASLPPPEIK